MLQELKMYTILCDNCKADSCDGGEYYGYVCQDTARDNAMDSDFIEHEGKHYCSNCWSHDDDDNVVIDLDRCKS